MRFRARMRMRMPGAMHLRVRVRIVDDPAILPDVAIARVRRRGLRRLIR